MHVGIALADLVVQGVSDRKSVPEPHAQPAQMLGEVAAQLVILGKRRVKALGGERDQAIDQGSVVRLRRHARFHELDEAQDEFGDRRDIRVGEREVGHASDRGRDARRRVGDGVIDQRAQLPALEHRVVPSANASRHDRDEQRLDHRHRAVVVGVMQLLAKDPAIARQIEPADELLEGPA